MPGINKYNEKERRQARRNFQRDHIKADLRTPKYRERTWTRKRVDNDDGSYYFGEWTEDLE